MINITKEFLQVEYLDKRKFIRQIAQECDKGYDYIRYKLIKYNIPRRNYTDAQCSKFNNVLTKKFLTKEYIANKKSAYKIGKEVGVSHTIIIKYLNKCNITIRNYKEAGSMYIHWNYKGGKRKCYICGKLIGRKYKWCLSCSRYNMWQNEEFREKRVKLILQGMKLSPNKPEKALFKLLNKLLPNEYSFVGDGQLIVDGFCPDFVNKDNNKIIEMYGDYWHNLLKWKERDKRRIKSYKKHNYKTLIIWEHELKDRNSLVNKLLKFYKEI